MGTAENIAVTQEIAAWLITSIRKEANMRYKLIGKPETYTDKHINTLARRQRKSFCLGAGRTVFQRARAMMQVQTEKTDEPGTALILVRNQLTRANDDFKSKLGLSKKPQRAQTIAGAAYAAGVEHGHGIGLNRQVSGSSMGRISSR